MKPDVVVDCTGLFCPEPIFRTRMALDGMDKGQVLEVTADDPAAEEDLKRLAARLGHTVIEVRKEGEEVTLLIRK
jgi:tRNA 2-thiouridine synthesizing protein A